MAYPTDIYVALTQAPTGIEGTFQTVSPNAIRHGERLVMFFDVMHRTVDEVDDVLNEVFARLAGCDYFWALLEQGEVLEHGGDITHSDVLPLSSAAHTLH
jgi:hypothetical protein